MNDYASHHRARLAALPRLAQVRALLTRDSDADSVLQGAAERFHEVPYTFERGRRSETGVINASYCVGEEWRLVDFKTHEIRAEEKSNAKVSEYRDQVARYADTVHTLVGATTQAELCFLDARGAVRVVTCRT